MNISWFSVVALSILTLSVLATTMTGFFVSAAGAGTATNTHTLTHTASESHSHTSNTPSHSHSTTLTHTQSPTGTSLTPTHSESPTATSLTPSHTLTLQSLSKSPSLSRSLTFTKSPSASPTATSNTQSRTKTNTRVPTPSKTRSRSLSLTKTETPSRTVTPGPTLTKSLTKTRSPSPSFSRSRTETETKTVTPPPTRTQTSSRTNTFTKSPSPSESLSPSPSQSPTMTDTHTESDTLTHPPTKSASKSRTQTLSETPSPSPSLSVSQTLSFGTRTHTLSEAPTDTTYTPFLTVSNNTGTETWTKSRGPAGTHTFTHSHSESLTRSGETPSTRSITLSKPITPPPTLTHELTDSRSATQTTGTLDTASLPPTMSNTETHTKTVSPSRTLEPTESESHSESHTLTPSQTDSYSDSLSVNTETWTRSPPPTISPSFFTFTATPSPSYTMSNSASASWSVSPDKSVTYSKSIVPTPSKSIVPTDTPSESWSRTLSDSVTHSYTVSRSGAGPHGTDTETETRTQTESDSHSLTESHSYQPTPSNTVPPTDTVTLSISGTGTDGGHRGTLTETHTLSESRGGAGTHTPDKTTSWTDSIPLTQSPSPDNSLSFTQSLSQFSDSMSMSHPLTTSMPPPTTSPVPTPTFTFMTHCPTNCIHGNCNNVYPYWCICFFSASKGYWGGNEFGGPCDKCARGFYGARCDEACPGGSCALCGGHGDCDDGKEGSGDCICWNSTVDGFWEGTNCNLCQAGWYQSRCQEKCLCHKGVCSDGLYGDGSCACDYGWKGKYCEICDPAIVIGCANSLQCAPSPDDPCSSHGVCLQVDATFNGQCQCDTTWAGEGCESQCPGLVSPTTACGGHGVCQDGRLRDASCVCDTGYAAPACTTCVNGFWGPLCDKWCPGMPDAPCNNSGTCNSLSGVCQCQGGYGGVNCNISCPVGGNGKPCSGNGYCNANAECVCYNDDTNGWFNGTTCDRCQEGVRGSRCNIQCPRLNGVICNGNGVCEDTGKCNCTYPSCGRICDIVWNGTRCNSCPVDGFYGPNCSEPCACVNGTCSMGKTGDGSCECERGFAGRYCNETCVGGIDNPCSGHGDCIQATGKCNCFTGFATENCSVQCPDLTCSGHGVCSEGTLGDGTCACHQGWIGPSCETECNCIHGHCIPGNSTCICDGNFTGPRCEDCVSGLAGSNCNMTCVHGRTNWTNCICDAPWVGPQCDLMCPQNSANVTCNAKGTCDPVLGKCSCDPGFFGPACTCTHQGCRDQYNVYATCEVVSGECQCAGNRAGLTAGCEVCKFGFYGAPAVGPHCRDACPCNNHGSCDKVTGACSCFADEENGFYEGVNCQQCLTGFMGANCQQKAVTLTTVTPITYRATINIPLAYTFMDPYRKMYYVGGGFYNLVYNITPLVPSEIHAASVPGSCKSADGITVLPFGGEGGDIFGIHNDTVRKQWVYFQIFNSSEGCNDAPVRVYNGPAEDYSLKEFVVNKSLRLLRLMDKGAMKHSFFFEHIDVACAIGSPGGSLSVECQTMPPAGIKIGKPLEFISFKNAFKSPTNISRYIAVGMGLENECKIQHTTLPPGGLSFVDTIPHSVHDEVWSMGLNCKGVDQVFETPDGLLLWGGTTNRGGIIGGYNIDPLRVWQPALVTSTQSICKGLTYDEDSGIGIAIFDRTAIKFRFGVNVTDGRPTIDPYGQQVLQVQDIVRLDLFSSEQLVYAPRRQVRGFQILRFLLVEVLSIEPDLADRRGGAMITVTGRGFRNKPEALCKFGQSFSPATFISKAQVKCIAPGSTSTDTCLVQSVEVSMNGNMFTQNQVPINRPKDVVITGITPPRVRQNEPGLVVSLYGRGFIDNVATRCKYQINPADEKEFVITPAIYVSPTEYKCDLSKTVTLPDGSVGIASSLISAPGAYVTLGLDGQVFSATHAGFEIVGPAVGVICTPKLVSNGSNEEVQFRKPFVTILTHDARGNVLREFDNEPLRHASVSVKGDGLGFRIVPTSEDPRSIVRYDVVNGTAAINEFLVKLPPVGRRTLQVAVEDTAWSCEFESVIEAGSLRALKMKTQPVGEHDIVQPGSLIPQTTEVITVDSGGNVVAIPDSKLNCSFVNFNMTTGEMNESFMPLDAIGVRDTGVAALQPFIVDLVFGMDYAILFKLATDGTINITTNKFRAGCPDTEYQVDGESKCRTCPGKKATCDGSGMLLNRAGFWRNSNLTVNFLKCPNPDACPSGNASFMGAAVCAHGYQGALCDDCIKGYGKDGRGLCSECPNKSTSGGLLFLIVFLCFVFLFTMEILVVQNNPIPTSSLGRATVLLGMFVTAQQTMSLLSFTGVLWPVGMRVVLNISAFLFEFRFYALHAVNCLFRDFEMNDSYAWLLFMGMTLCVFPMMFIVKAVLKWKPKLLLAKACADARREFDKMARANFTGFWYEGYVKEHQTMAIAMTTLQVFVFFLLQIDMYYLLSMLQCTTIGLDELGNPIILMKTDVRVNCESDSYKNLFALALTTAVLFGLCSTVGAIILMGYYRYRRYEDDFQSVWGFFYLGMKIELWFWNPLILCRKVLLVVVISFMAYPISLYIFVWTMMGWTWLEYEKRPYIDDDFNQLSTVFNCVLMITGNIGMTLQVIDVDMTKMILDFLNVLIVVSAIGLFVWKCSRMFIQQYLKERREAAIEEISDIDEAEVEKELQARLDDEAELDERQKARERESLEKIQKEVRAAAAAANAKYSGKDAKFDDDEDQEMDPIGKAVREDAASAAGGDVSAFMNTLADKAKREQDDRRSMGGKDADETASFAPERVGDDRIDMVRRGDAASAVSDNRSAINDNRSAVSRGSHRGGGRRGNDAVLTTTYVPPSKSEVAQGKDEVDTAIDDFLSGAGVGPAIGTGSPSADDALNSILKHSPKSESSPTSGRSSLLSPGNAFATPRGGAVDPDAEGPSFNRPKFVDAKLNSITAAASKPALPVALPAAAPVQPLKPLPGLGGGVSSPHSGAGSPSAAGAALAGRSAAAAPPNAFMAPGASLGGILGGAPASPAGGASPALGKKAAPALPVPLPVKGAGSAPALPVPLPASGGASPRSGPGSAPGSPPGSGRAALPVPLRGAAAAAASNQFKVTKKQSVGGNPFMTGGGGDMDDDL